MLTLSDSRGALCKPTLLMNLHEKAGVPLGQCGIEEVEKDFKRI